MNTEDIINCLKQIKDNYTWNAQADLALVFAIKCVERFGEEMEVELNDEKIKQELRSIQAEMRDLADWYYKHGMEDITQVICVDVMPIIDKHMEAEIDE